jgi:hypothetical protein
MRAKAASRRDRRLFLAGRVGLPRRQMRSRRRVGAARLWRPRGLRRAAEAHEPFEEIGTMLVKRGQNGFCGEGNLCVHIPFKARGP